MIFTEVRFIVLLAACGLTFFVVPRRRRSLALAAWGIVFYFSYAGAFLPVVLALTVLTYFAHRRAIAWIAGSLITMLLLLFKLGASGSPAIAAAASTTTVLVPLGFSFLAFELLHVIIDRRRGRIVALSLVDLLAFAFFFPARVAGPIKRFPEFIIEVTQAEASVEHIYAGSLRVLLGLSKKLLVADVLALTVAERAYAQTPLRAWIIVLAYALQIYVDFSAYSDIAIGFARMLGIRLPENFRAPYFAPNIREFWNRWHMTLSAWVRDYVFMPMGHRLFQTALRTSPMVIAVLSYLVTFLVVGAWHGVTGAFLVWGLYHGVLLSIHHVVRARMPHQIARHPWYNSAAASVLSGSLTFICVAVGWVPFMSDLSGAAQLLALMFGGGS